MRFLVPRRAVGPALAVALVVGLVACVPATTLPDDCDAATVQRQATLAGESLDPATIEVCRDQDVSIQIAIERDAVLDLHGYDDQVAAEEVHAGETVTFRFEATRAGEFPFEIHAHDGPAEATAGTLVVHEP